VLHLALWAIEALGGGGGEGGGRKGGEVKKKLPFITVISFMITEVNIFPVSCCSNRTVQNSQHLCVTF
jgi:hypothetical protein